MSLNFTKVTYVNGETVITAENLNDMQDALLDLDDNKVEKEQGKGLSTNDYTNADKQKVNDAYVAPEGGIPKTALSQSVQESLEKADEVPDLKSAVNDPITGLDSKAPVIIDTASGVIASFPDGADGMSLKSLTVDIEPVQDLHGYDNPWPAGCGKNLLEIKEVTRTRFGITITVNKDSAGNTVSVSLSGTATESNLIYLGQFYAESGSYKVIGGSSAANARIGYSATDPYGNRSPGTHVVSGSNILTFTVSNAGYYIYSFASTEGTVYDTTIYPMIMLASVTDDTFAPYSNICPISGWTDANITRTGKNLLDVAGRTISSQSNVNTIVLEGCSATKNGDTITATITGPWSKLRFAVDANILKAGEIYTLSAKFNNPSGRSVGLVYMRNGQWNGLMTTTATQASVSISFTFDPTISIVAAVVNNSGTSNGETVECSEMQIVRGSTAQPYVPYAGGDIISITFPSPDPGTVYKGSIDWIAKKLKSRPYYASYNDEPLVGPWISSMDVYSPGTTPTIGAQVVDMGGAETIYDLTVAPEIDTLYGANNIWTDCGDVTVEYPADTKLYIDALTAPTEDDMTTDTQIASGKYFLIGNTLYLSTTVIPAGDTIIPGTNCQKTNLAAALNALNS